MAISLAGRENVHRLLREVEHLRDLEGAGNAAGRGLLQRSQASNLAGGDGIAFSPRGARPIPQLCAVGEQQARTPAAASTRRALPRERSRRAARADPPASISANFQDAMLLAQKRVRRPADRRNRI